MMMQRSAAPPPMAMASAMAVPSPPPSAPTPVAQPTPKPPSQVKKADAAPDDAPKEQSLDAGGDADATGVDYTQIPNQIDQGLDKFTDGSVRPTTIKPATEWTKKFQIVKTCIYCVLLRHAHTRIVL
jgi:hypothetical protein